jgi:hypothetical protein
MLSVDVHCIHALIKNLAYETMQKMTQGNVYFVYGRAVAGVGSPGAH